MSIGIVITKNDVDAQSGNLTRNLQRTIEDSVQFKFWLDAQTDAQLNTLGFSNTEVVTLRAAFTDFAQLVTIYKGTATLAVAKDFRLTLQKLWGFGAL